MRKKKAKKILKEVRKTYETIAKDFSQTRSHYGKEFEIYLKQLKKGGTIADIGCGNGRFGGFLRENQTQIDNYHYLGIDQSEKLLDIAQKKYPQETFLQGDLLKLPLDDESVQAIVTIRTFHHLPSYELRLQALFEFQRVLKKDGILIISVWNLWQKNYWFELLKAVVRCIFTFGSYEYNDTFIPWGKEAKRYYHAFTLRELKKIVKRSGFKIVATPVVEDVKDLIIIAHK